MIDKQEFIKYCTKLCDKGLSPGYSGNVSVRQDDNVFITCSGKSLGDLTEDDIVQLDMQGNIINGKMKPSSEIIMHLAIYNKRNDFKSIIHCQAPKTSAFAVAGVPLSAPILSESILTIGEVPVVKYLMPSSAELAAEVSAYFEKYSAVLMANHGVILGGDSLKNAYYRMETLEYTAEVYLLSKILGRTNTLNPDEISDILALKTKHKVY